MYKLTDFLYYLIESDIDNSLYLQYKDVKIKNPKSGRNIKISTALSNKKHPAYKTAKEFIDSKNENSDEVSTETKIKELDTKINNLKQDYQTANDNLEFDKISSITKQIHELQTEKNKYLETNKKHLDSNKLKFKQLRDKKEIINYVNTYKDIPDPLLKKEEKEIASIYRGNGYVNINNALRQQKVNDPKLKKQIKQLNNAINKSKLKDDISLFRGMKLNDKLKQQLSKLKPGDSFTDNAFSSTSLDENIVNKLFGGKKDNEVIFQINAKKGQKGLPMNNIDPKGYDKEEFEEEAEILLPLKSKFKLVSIEGNKYIFDIEE